MADVAEAKRQFSSTQSAWSAAGRNDKPRHITGTFVSLGNNSRDVLRQFAYEYLEVFSPDFARQLSDSMRIHEKSALRDLLVEMKEGGCDEFIVVPATSDPAMADEVAEVVAEVS